MEEHTMHWKDIDGVATLTIDAGLVPGPLRACLAFGSGIVDESLHNRGINHVVEHLALHGSDAQSARLINGSVDTLMTRFWVAGTPEQVAGFLEFVTGNLAALPLDRLDDELRVMQIEANGRVRSPFGGDLEERFGPRGGGLCNWAEIGFRTLDRDDVAAWAKARFTAANAVLWCSGPLPAGLSLASLPAGPKVSGPRCPAPQTPARALVPLDRPVGVSFLAEASWTTAAAAEAIRQEAFDRLRAAALSYSVSATMLRLDATTQFWGITADGVDGELDRVLSKLIAAVEQIAAHGPTERELAAQRQGRELTSSTADRIVEHLDAAARWRLFGVEPTTMAEGEQAWQSITSDDVRAEVERAMPTALAFGPVLSEAVPDAWTHHASWEKGPVAGKRYEPIPGRAGGQLIAGTRGVTRHFDEHNHHTMRWQEIEACLVEGSTFHVVDGSGNVLSVTPASWRGGEDLVPLLEQNIDSSLLIQLRRPMPTTADNDRARANDCWLATITLVEGKGSRRHGADRVSLVIDTDGIFVVSDDGGNPESDERMAALRSADHDALLSRDPRNRWIARKSLASVELGRTVGVVVARRVGSLRIRTNSGETYEFRLPLPKQVDLARDALTKMLGDRFVDRDRQLPARVRSAS
jgi:hypothetical protein